MNLYICFLFSIFLLLSQTQSLNTCPPANKLSPCTCQESDRSITCSDINEKTDLKKVFARSADKQPQTFSSFTLKNCHLKKFYADWFQKMFNFNKILVQNCTQMTEFGFKALADQNKFATELIIRDTPITDPNLNLTHDNTYSNIFRAVTLVPSLLNVDLSGTQLTEIPEDAFFAFRANIGEMMMQKLLFCSEGQKCRSIKSIGSRPFFYLVHLREIDLSRHLIEKVSGQAFLRKTQQIPTQLNTMLTIRLDDNKLTEDSFDKESFTYFHPGLKVKLSLANNKNLTELRESVFKPFLANNDVNTMNVTGCPIQWSSKTMNWVNKLDPKVRSRIIR